MDEHAALSAGRQRSYVAEIKLLLEVQEGYKQLTWDLHAIQERVDLAQLHPDLRKFLSSTRLLELMLSATSLILDTQLLLQRREEENRSRRLAKEASSSRVRPRHR